MIDIYQQPTLAKGEQIIAAPTLIKKLPLPLRRFIGNMADKEKILVGLDLRPKEARSERRWPMERNQKETYRNGNDPGESIRISVKQRPRTRRVLEEIEDCTGVWTRRNRPSTAIRNGDVDALVVAGPQGEQVFSLTGAEHVYRVIVETMNEAALTVDLDGTILFCNQRFCDLMKTPIQEAIGRKR